MMAQGKGAAIHRFIVIGLTAFAVVYLVSGSALGAAELTRLRISIPGLGNRGMAFSCPEIFK